MRLAISVHWNKLGEIDDSSRNSAAQLALLPRQGGTLTRYEYDDDDQRVMTLDDLLGPVPENPAGDAGQSDHDFFHTMSRVMTDKNPSKSQRVRDFLTAQPNARNRDCVEALAEYGVTAADVSNAKAQLKRQGASSSKRGRPASANSTTPATTASPKASVETGNGTGGSIGMSEIDAALSFVRQIGSIDRAKQLLVIIQQIQQL